MKNKYFTSKILRNLFIGLVGFLFQNLHGSSSYTPLLQNFNSSNRIKITFQYKDSQQNVTDLDKALVALMYNQQNLVKAIKDADIEIDRIKFTISKKGIEVEAVEAVLVKYLGSNENVI